jgi:putative flippase GtrA
MIKFGLTGVVNTVIGLGIIFALKGWFAVPDTAANLAGYCVGFAVSVVLNARWTFQYRQALAPVVPGYALVILIAYLANLACVHFCIDVLHINSYLAQAAGVVPYAAITFFLSRRYVFRQRS